MKVPHLPLRASRRSASKTSARFFKAIEALEQRTLLAAHIVGSTTSYATIQAAVNAASAGAIINVDPGTYPEQVTISKSLTLRGAQTGVDARSNARHYGVNETVLTGAVSAGLVTSSFYINANDVTIDGFTVQGNTSAASKSDAGIVIAPNHAGTHIINNIVQNNISGLDLANNSATDPAIIQYNVFQNNNNDGEEGGRGIYTNSAVSGGNLTNVTIDSNTFFKNFGGADTTNLEAAVALESNKVNSQSNIRITNNVMDSDGKGVLAWNTSNLTITGNFITYVRDVGSGALRFEGGDSNVTITGNEIYNNPGIAIHIDNKATDGDNKTFTITGNNIYGNGLDNDPVRTGGLVIEPGQYQGALNATNNYWGSATGPSGDGTGTGDAVKANQAAVTFTPFSTTPVFSQQLPYWGLPSVAGAQIQMEDFDHGGQNIAYHDNDVDNDGGRYRPYQSVDIEGTTDTTGVYDILSVEAGEWLAYTVNVPQAGAYQFDFRAASGQTTGGQFHVEIDGANVSGTITVPYTGGGNNWLTFSKTNVILPAGQHVMKIVFDTAGNNGNLGDFNWFQYTYAGIPTAPSAPTNLAAMAVSPSQINLNWTNTANNQTGYNIDRSTDGVTFAPLATNVTTTSYSDTGLTPGTTYYYEVRATNAVGDSPNSNIASDTTLPASATPVYLSDLAWFSATTGYGTIQRDKSINGNVITLRGATYAKGIGTHAVSNIVYKLNGQYNTFVSDVGVDDEENGKGIGSVDFQVIGDGVVLFDSAVVTNNSAIVHISISVAGVQQLTLVANNGVANSIDYDHADWAGAYLLGTPLKPSAPVNLTATATSNSQINLSWTNTATNQTGFKIERSTDGVTFAPVTTVAANVTTFSDTGLSPSTPYTYRVRATNAAGDSANSNAATTTTFSATVTQTYLSDIPWVSAIAGYGTTQRDASIKGNPITLRGVTYAKGIGTHADSTITYNLNGQYSTFLSDIGIDDEVNGQGSIHFQVFGDGVLLFDSGTLTGASATMSINVNVTGVKTLQLMALTTIPGDIDYDHADWANARLLTGG